MEGYLCLDGGLQLLDVLGRFLHHLAAEDVVSAQQLPSLRRSPALAPLLLPCWVEELQHLLDGEGLSLAAWNGGY
jgi:hypothetical protein